MAARLNEFEKAVRLYARIQATPWALRKKKFGRRWPVVIQDVWYFAETCGVPEAEVSRRLRSIDRPMTVDELLVVVPN